MKRRSIFIVLVMLAGITDVASQEKEFPITNYTQEEGLPSNESYFVFRDSKNYLWIATDKGVVRFDGRVMQTFNLIDNVVFKIREDHRGRIWFFTSTGKLSYFFRERVYPYEHNDKIEKGMTALLIVDAYVDSADNIHINSGRAWDYKIFADGRIEKYKYVKAGQNYSRVEIEQTGPHSYFTRFTDFYYASDKLVVTYKGRGRQVEYLIPAKLYEYTHHGCRVGPNGFAYFFAAGTLFGLKPDGTHILKNFESRVLCISINPDGTLWVGTAKGGMNLLNENLEKILDIPALAGNSVSSVAQDYEGGTWFTTLEKGVFYLKDLGIYQLKGDSSLTQEVFRIHHMRDHSLLYGNSDGIFNLTDKGVTPLLKKRNSFLADLFTDSSNNIYLTGHMPSFKDVHDKAEKQGRFLIFYANSEIARVKDRLTWNNGGYWQSLVVPGFPYRADLPSKIFLTDSAYLFMPAFTYSDNSGNIWAGSMNGLYRYLPSRDSSSAGSFTSRYIDRGVTCMRELDNGFFAVGIRFGGIGIMNDTGLIATITEKDGLLNNSVRFLLPQKDRLWAATAKGISVIEFESFRPLKYTIRNVGRNKGFYNIIINQLIEHDHDVVAATSNGIYVLKNVSRFFQEPRFEIPLYITNLRYHRGDTFGLQRVTVPFAENSFTIQYHALTFNSWKDLKYYYRFANKDSNWQTTTNTELILENLAPGNYKLEIRAGIPTEMRWSPVQLLEIVVEKPWWQNNWLRLAGILLLASLIVFLYKRRIGKIRNQERQKLLTKTMMVEMEQKLLHSQMNPHFIFNSLTSIQQLIVNGDRTEANEHLVKLARLIRQTLDLSARSYVTVEEEKGYLEEYMVLEQYRVPSMFDFHIHVDPAIDATRTEIPNMMIQPIIENSIRHGIKHLENKKGLIDIKIEKDGDRIRCVITDNGVGRGNAGNNRNTGYTAHKSYGMEIVKKRLALLLGEKNINNNLVIHDLLNEDGTAAGTQVILQLPFKITHS